MVDAALATAEMQRHGLVAAVRGLLSAPLWHPQECRHCLLCQMGAASPLASRRCVSSGCIGVRRRPNVMEG